MLFNSSTFLVFFLIVFALYRLSQRSLKTQNLLILLSSYFFYGWWDVRFLFLIVASTAIDYSAGQMISIGRISNTDRLKLTLFVMVSALLFLAMRWDAMDTVISLQSISIDVDWANLWNNPSGWKMTGIVGVVLVVANFLHAAAARLSENRRRRVFLTLSIVANLGILGFFKYFNFFANSLATALASGFGVTASSWTLDIVLPVGISFYTFQTMSYTIDVARKEIPASRNLTEFGAYVAFFPQLVAGPIERGKQLLPQFQKLRKKPDREALGESLWLITWGLFKKIVIADNMATIANATFAPYDALDLSSAPDDGLRLLVGLYAFAFQIYGDFSGYTDIARGVARLMGFKLMLNFNLPYCATSPSDFWRRWHISLSTWLRDYLYIPLGGNKGGNFAVYRNLSLTMLLGGLWHGPSWTFVAWGAYHGALLSIYRLIGLRTEQKKTASVFKRFLLWLLMFHLTCLGWLLFRAQNMTTIKVFLEGIFLKPFGSPETWENLSTVFFYSWFLILFQTIQFRTKDLLPHRRWPWFLKLNLWIFVIMSILTLASALDQEFIYFAF